MSYDLRHRHNSTMYQREFEAIIGWRNTGSGGMGGGDANTTVGGTGAGGTVGQRSHSRPGKTADT